MSSYADRLSLMEARLKLVEEYTVTRKIAEAREDERDKALYERLDRMDGKMKTIETDVNGIKGLGTKALGIIGVSCCWRSWRGFSREVCYDATVPGPHPFRHLGCCACSGRLDIGPEIETRFSPVYSK